MEQPVILIAEDEPIVGLDLCDTMTEAGYLIEGPHGDLNSAMLAFQKRFMNGYNSPIASATSSTSSPRIS